MIWSPASSVTLGIWLRSVLGRPTPGAPLEPTTSSSGSISIWSASLVGWPGRDEPRAEEVGPARRLCRGRGVGASASENCDGRLSCEAIASTSEDIRPVQLIYREGWWGRRRGSTSKRAMLERGRKARCNVSDQGRGEWNCGAFFKHVTVSLGAQARLESVVRYLS